MKMLITGANGFLGKEVVKFFDNENVEYMTLGRSTADDICVDLTHKINPINYDTFHTVVHIAGKAHNIPKTEVEKQEFYDVNYMGTLNLLSSLKNNPPKNFIFISTVAVYGLEQGKGIDETYELKGNTPYALSKIQAEKEVVKFGEEFKVNTSILRLPLITGPNSIGNLRSMINSIKRGYYFRVGNGCAERSLVSASDIGPLVLELNGVNGIFNISSTNAFSIKDIDSHIAKLFNKKIKVLPYFFVKYLSSIGDVISLFPLNKSKFKKLTSTLTFSNTKVIKATSWKPTNPLEAIK